jgi:ribosomal protein S18 acetylase RimI-like enzyme
VALFGGRLQLTDVRSHHRGRFGRRSAPTAERQDVIQTSKMNTPEPHATLFIRSFQAADRGALEQLWARVFADDPPWNAPGIMIEAKLKVQSELLLVGKVGEDLVGAVMAGFDGVRGWIYHLAVAPEWRRRGFATRLVRAAERGLRTLGCAKVNLQVRPTNREVVAFYRTLGYGIEERVSMGRRLEGDG